LDTDIALAFDWPLKVFLLKAENKPQVNTGSVKQRSSTSCSIK